MIRASATCCPGGWRSSQCASCINGFKLDLDSMLRHVDEAAVAGATRSVGPHDNWSTRQTAPLGSVSGSARRRQTTEGAFSVPGCRRTLMLPRESKPSSWLTISSIVRCTSLSPPCPSSKRAPPIASICKRPANQHQADSAVIRMSNLHPNAGSGSNFQGCHAAVADTGQHDDRHS